ncbi:MAG: hypothetical protein V4621_00220 [Pseudomonadota bacterium]
MIAEPTFMQTPTRTAYVIFSNETSFFWLRFLKTGFRHCAVIIPATDRPRGWTIVDPLSHHLLVDDVTVPEGCPDLPEQLRQAGHILVSVVMAPPPHRPAPIMPLSCVEVTKRLLGIHSKRVWTPYQLYLYLTNPKTRRRQSPWVA